MDRFTAYAPILMAIIASAFIAATYLGQALSKKEMEGTDAIVEDTAVSTANKEPVQIVPAIPENLEPIGFTLAGIIGGFLFGFFWFDAFERRD